jgi:hypothetical protein
VVPAVAVVVAVVVAPAAVVVAAGGVAWPPLPLVVAACAVFVSVEVVAVAATPAEGAAAAGFLVSCACRVETDEKQAAKAATVQALLKRMMTLSWGDRRTEWDRPP